MKDFLRQNGILLLVAALLLSVALSLGSAVFGSPDPVSNAVGAVINPFRSGITSVLDWFGGVQEYVLHYDELHAELDDLRAQVAKLEDEVRQNEQAARENEKLRERGETIRKQQETIDALNKELDKYKGLKLEDFENNMEAYADWKAKEASMQNEVKFRKEMMEREQREAAELETARREELSFEDEDEREEYREMLRVNGPNFYDALQKADADLMHPNGKGEIAKAVLGYLSNVDKYPVVLKQLMDLKTGALRKVFSGSKDPEIIRTNLHQLTMELLSEQKKTSENSVAQKQPQGSTKPLPVIGKQVSANSKPSEPVHDRAYWTNYAKTHR